MLLEAGDEGGCAVGVKLKEGVDACTAADGVPKLGKCDGTVFEV